MGEPSFKIGIYRVVRRLGEGGMGAVFEAVHEAIERRVAIKVLHPEYARNAEFIARFFNEARAVNRVAHPGLVQVSDYGQQPDGTSYIVMEFLEGESLARRMDRLGGKLPTPETIHLGWQLADSLSAAHEKGIIHRDLKPDNVMIVPDPHMASGERTKLLDFGIAKVAEQGGAPRLSTRVGQVMGTPTYMSPEQCAGGGGVDAKSDVYSLGVMLFELLAGKPPFSPSDEHGNVLTMHMFVAPPLLHKLAPAVPPRLADLVQRLLAKNKEARPTMRQVAATLERMAEQQPPPKRSASNQALRPGEGELPDATILVGHSSPRLSTLGQSAAQTVQRGPRLRQVGLALGMTLGAVAIATALVLQLARRTGKQQAARNAASAQALTAPEKRVTLHIDSEPSGALVLRISDGQVLGQTPWQVIQPAADGRLQLRVRLDGHEEQDLSLAANQDQHAAVRLLPSRPPPTRPAKRSDDKRRSKPPKGKIAGPAGQLLHPRIID